MMVEKIILVTKMEKSSEYPSKNDPLEGETHKRESLSPRFLCFPSSLTLIQTPDPPPSPSPVLVFVVSSSPFSMPLAMLGMSPCLLCSDNDLYASSVYGLITVAYGRILPCLWVLLLKVKVFLIILSHFSSTL